MKSKKRISLLVARFFFVLALLLLFSCPALAQSGGGYDLSWSTIDGGGGRSSGGTYVLEGTVGQPDAGAMTGGAYALAGGFWARPFSCFVDLPDLADFADQWLTTGSGLAWDLNNDQIINLLDYALLANLWLKYCPDSWSWR